MNFHQIFFSVVFLFLLVSCNDNSVSEIDLSGTWEFRMDPEDQGVPEEWFNSPLDDTVKLPGSMAENRKGYDVNTKTHWTGGFKNNEWHKDARYAPYHDPDHFRFPFCLQPEKKYYGAAWYRKKVVIPDGWRDKHVWLYLERPHWETVVWINDVKAGSKNSLATPHVYDISPFINTGENFITLRIDNRIKEIDVGINSHSITDHTQTNWNGVAGKIALFTESPVFFEKTKIFPDAVNKSITIKTTIFNSQKKVKDIEVSARARLKKTGRTTNKESWPFTLLPGRNVVTMHYSLGKDAFLWDEFNPNVYELSLKLNTDGEMEEQIVDFGLRDFKVDGTRFSINGRPLFLRGTLECAIFPQTGYPPTDVESWKKIYAALKSHGLNHMRFHSWCPPEAAFDAADEMGIYLQVECSSWANQSTKLGVGLPVDQYIWEESKRIVDEYGNHPSFVMMAYGNEPGGPDRGREYLRQFVSYWKREDPRRVYTSAAGWPVLEENEYHNIPDPRIQGWGEGLHSIINAEPPTTNFDWSDRLPTDGVPVISHEIGQWCVYPDFKEIEKYTGVLKPKNFEIFRESLAAHRMGDLADSFLLASGKLQALCYKADIEAALRTPGFAGFQLLDLHDFPGQGTALVGVLDPFWEEKGYISPEEYRRFSNSTVPLARLERRIFIEGDTLTAAIEAAHFGEEPLLNVNPLWKLISNEVVVAEGKLDMREIPFGNCISLGNVTYQFPRLNQPRKMILEVQIMDFVNSWGLWVYPDNQDIISDEIMIVEKLDQRVFEFLENEGKVLLSLGKSKVNPETGGSVGVGFSSIFWNTAWTNNQKPHTLGILCNPNHPALELFPTDYYSDWQWWDAMSHSDAIQLDSFNTELQPIVRIVDDWVTNRRLALFFEAKVGDGKILVSGVDLVNNLENRPAARQLKKSLIRYMESNHFNPAVKMNFDEIKKIPK